MDVNHAHRDLDWDVKSSEGITSGHTYLALALQPRGQSGSAGAGRTMARCFSSP